MIATIIKSVITFVISGALGYCVNVIKTLKEEKKKEKEKRIENENVQNEALKTILQNNLTSIYYVYSEIGSIPDYALKNWINLLSAYESLGGDDYIHELDTRIRNMKVIVTGVIK